MAVPSKAIVRQSLSVGRLTQDSSAAVRAHALVSQRAPTVAPYIALQSLVVACGSSGVVREVSAMATVTTVTTKRELAPGVSAHGL